MTERDEHVIEAVGRCRMVIRNGVVEEVGEPLITECPLAKRFAVPVERITRESARANIAGRIQSFGMCREDREVLARADFVGFGASELICGGIRAGTLDAAILACDGAGSIIVSTPELVQGTGGRMSGLVCTTPIQDVIRRLAEAGGIVVDPDHASIDPVTAIPLAHHHGFRHLAVTVATAETAVAVKKADPGALVIAVHTTGLSDEDVRVLVKNADIITSCASRAVREIAGPVALLQAGSGVPVFAMTRAGKQLILTKCAEISTPLYLAGAHLPVASEREPRPLV
jgi:putative methanogenesis marker protein 8